MFPPGYKENELSDEFDWSTRVLTAGGFVSLLLLMWIGLLKSMLGKYITVLEDNTRAFHALNVRVARVEGRLGIKGPEEPYELGN